MSAVKLNFVIAESPEQIEAARALFREYGASLGFSLCFQSFDQELAGLPGSYAPPRGRLLLALDAEKHAAPEYAGCVALHPLEDDICEMKRLYVRPEFRGRGVGQQLVSAIITAARELGYKSMRLDTVPGVMDSAIKMYRQTGFSEILPYTHNPVPGAIFMELAL
jgi:putative acetyltransferase